MADPLFEQFARVLVEYALDVQPGQLVVVTTAPSAKPLLLAVHRQILARGAHPVVQIRLPELTEQLYRYASDEQLQYVAFDEQIPVEQADALLTILATTNTRALTSVDPQRMQRAQQARMALQETYLRRAAEGTLNWCLTLFPTEAYAQDAEMSLEEYTAFLAHAAFLDTPDPVAAWQAQSQEQQRLIDWLRDKREVHIRGQDTDLRLSIAGRTFISADGHKNFPDGEIFTSPVEHTVEGTIRFSFPALVGGREVEDIRLWFEGGRVVRATAAKNEHYLHRMLETDEGARVVGEFAFGLNRAIDRFTKQILFDEKIGGTVHLALGAGYPETGSRNRSAIHWDMICDLRQGGEVWIDGQLFLKDGQIVV
jgi:aminopeptidase